MKRLLLLSALIILFTCKINAQPCIGYIPEDAIVLCDTSYNLYYPVASNNTTYWMVNDTAGTLVGGNNNTFYYTGSGQNHTRVDGRNNTYHMVAAKPSALVFGNTNTLYMHGNSFIDLRGDSNTIYVHNVRLRLTGNNNVIYADSINFMNNTGINNTILQNPCTGVEVSTLHAPSLLCDETTGVIENKVDIDVYPNPATENVTFNTHNIGQVKSIVLFDIAGKAVVVIANITNDKVTIDTSRLGAGMYVYSIILANGKTERGKLLVG